MLIIRHVRRTAVSRQQSTVSRQPELSACTRGAYNNVTLEGKEGRGRGRGGGQLTAESVVHYGLCVVLKSKADIPAFQLV